MVLIINYLYGRKRWLGRRPRVRGPKNTWKDSFEYDAKANQDPNKIISANW